ncbi:murein transglycosylase domain-containing protein [Cetobacterium sp.]|uniref:transglycosylase SLT domain-containing protein n=1 Tax=Cetobacterium sp. TaxID=2071632 RepID=UPI003F30B66A
MKKLTIYIFMILSKLLISDSNISEFEKYRNNRKEMYQGYKTEIERRFENYKNNIEEEWVEIEIPDRYRWVEYSDDFKERSIVDYENEKLTIEVTVSKDTSETAAQELIMRNMQSMMKQYVSEASKKNPYIEQNKTLKSNESVVGDIYKVENKKPEDIKKEVKKMVQKEKPKVLAAKKTNEKVVQVSIPFPKDGVLSKAAKFSNHVSKRGKEYGVEESLIYAIIHSESAFNPMARSHIPAYGLMQIVPVSAGKDISKRLYGEVRIFTPEYLYNGEKNIEAGVNYLNLLYYSYLKGVKDPISRKYCTIAAYNTGSGNVAKAFTGNTNLSKALPIINSMSSKEVYNKLLKDLPYAETKGYLKKVTERDKYYSEKIKELKKI